MNCAVVVLSCVAAYQRQICHQWVLGFLAFVFFGDVAVWGAIETGAAPVLVFAAWTTLGLDCGADMSAARVDAHADRANPASTTMIMVLSIGRSLSFNDSRDIF
jgi:hypothetical protein